MNKKFLTNVLLLTLALGFLASNVMADEEMVPVIKPSTFTGLTPPTPISISGFSPEVEHILNFDLTVMGFIEVAPGSANYALTGKSAGVEGQLTYGKNVLLSKIYSGGSERAQAHRLADDVVLKITGVNGIAETRIAFKGELGRRSEQGNVSEIFISDFDGYNRQSVTRDGTIVAAPCWVPGRFALYYTSYKLGYPDIFYQDLATAQRRNFAHYNTFNSAAAVSPDGRRVAMILNKSGGYPDVWVSGEDGSGLKQLTFTHEASSPCWSPNGEWICFAATVNGRRALYKVPSGGGEIERIPTSGIANPTEPDWSPDGQWIAFTAQMGGFDICVVKAGGGSATPLVSGEDPSWAPNSRTLIFARRSGNGNRVLSLLDVPTKQVKDVSRVSGSTTSNSQPSWAR